MPKVSIIIPVYNAEKAINRCVDSVLNQEYQDFELLLMDDGSTDKSPSILDQYAVSDPRVRVVHKKNSGVSDTRNQAIALATGEFLQFIDADDWITPDSTKLFVRMAEENNADMVIADFYRVVGSLTSRKGDIDTNEVMDRETYADYMMKNPADYYYGVIWNKFYRKRIIDDYKIHMDVNLSWCEDFIFNMEYVLHAPRICALRVPVYYYVKTEGSLVQKSMNIGNIVRMKLNVIEYYNDFYRKIYDGEEYDQRRPEIYRFLIDYAGDDAAIPLMPGTRRLGEERVPVAMPENAREDIFLDAYYLNKLLDRYLTAAAMQFSLDLKDIKVLAFLRAAGTLRSLREVADYIGGTQIGVLRILQKLAAKRFVTVDPELSEIKVYVTAGPKAPAVFKLLDDIESDMQHVFSGEIPEDQQEAIRNDFRKSMDNVRKRLKNG